MPQVFCVVQCYSCRAFQVQQEKIKPEFKCPLCGIKQTMQRIFAKSNKAKECRNVVTSYNSARGTAEQDLLEIDRFEVAPGQRHQNEADTDNRPTCAAKFSRKWTEYADEEEPVDAIDWTIPAPSVVPKKPRNACPPSNKKVILQKQKVSFDSANEKYEVTDRIQNDSIVLPFAQQSENPPRTSRNGNEQYGVAEQCTALQEMSPSRPPQYKDNVRSNSLSQPQNNESKPKSVKGTKWNAFVDEQDV